MRRLICAFVVRIWQNRFSHAGLISGTLNITKTKKLVITSFYRPTGKVDENYLNSVQKEISDLKYKYKNANFLLIGDFDLPDINWGQQLLYRKCALSTKSKWVIFRHRCWPGLWTNVRFPHTSKNTLNLIFSIIPILRGCLQSLFNIPVPWYLFDIVKVISGPTFVSRCITDAYFSFCGLVLDIDMNCECYYYRSLWEELYICDWLSA